MRRALYEAVGGFTEDYVIGDYEDSDLCLKVRAKGLAVRYVPEAELYHLERRSMRVSPDHGRGTASPTMPGCTRSAGATPCRPSWPRPGRETPHERPCS